MTLKIGKRTLIRLSSFIAAIIVVLSVLAFNYSKEAMNNQRTLEYQYMKSVADLTAHIENIDGELSKVVYVNSPAMLSMLSSKLWREAGLAKESLSDLPVEYLSLQNTNKLLSQIGDYCVSLSKSFAKGQHMTDEERENLKALNQYSDTMLREVIAVNDGIQTGSISFAKVKGNIKESMKDDIPNPGDITEGFKDFEEGFTAYPTLIYDGPFSDHIMQKEPMRLKEEKNVSRAEAKKKAAVVTGLDVSKISDSNDEDSKMPSYCFTSEGIDISITKKGGLLSYMLNSRAVEKQSIDVETAQGKARKFMDSLNIGKLDATYYEIANNIITINYAAKQGNVLVYPDLIKISVAMDNGDIVGFDARGYIVNNYAREHTAPKLSEAQAKSFISPDLKIESSQLCIIPSDGLNEILCYEFKTKSNDGKDILVYANADNGAEERLLILLVTENGQLTF